MIHFRSVIAIGFLLLTSSAAMASVLDCNGTGRDTSYRVRATVVNSGKLVDVSVEKRSESSNRRIELASSEIDRGFKINDERYFRYVAFDLDQADWDESVHLGVPRNFIGLEIFYGALTYRVDGADEFDLVGLNCFVR